MRNLIIILFSLLTIQLFGQTSPFYKTIGKKNFHYVEIIDDKAIVYKMGRYLDKAGTGAAITFRDTLYKNNQQEYKGTNYSIIKAEEHFKLQNDKIKTLQIEPENNIDKVNTELNNAYYLKSYFDLSDKLNKEFPLYHYTFRNGYYAWNKNTYKTINHKQFVEQTDIEIKLIYDSIRIKQANFTKTTEFITSNVKQINYSILKDSLKTLPIDYRPQNGYFDKSVYQMTKSNPEYFYKLLQDFPTSKTFIYSAVDQDKELVKQLKQIQGYDDLKKEFLKDYKFGKTMGIKTLATYAVFGGLLAWLIIAQP
jgi:hypothetical protein